MDEVTRTVWDGDRVLKEIRSPWTKMEQDTGYVGGWAESSQYGQVLYLHGTGLDEPGLIARLNAGTLFRSEGSTRVNTELFLLLTPYVLRTDDDVEDATRNVEEGTRNVGPVLHEYEPLTGRERPLTPKPRS